jgi:phage gp45-like
MYNGIKSIKDAVDKAIKNIRNAAIGKVSSVLTSNKTAYVQISEEEELRDVKLISPYGFHSLPINGVDGQLLFNGNSSKKASLIGIEHTSIPEQLNPGEAIFYGASGSYILLKDGKIKLVGGLEINGNILDVNTTASNLLQEQINTLKNEISDLKKNGGGSDMPLMVVESEWEGSGNTTRTFANPVMGISIINTGSSSLTVSILDKTIIVDAGESFNNLFKPFTSLSITTTSTYKVLVTLPYNIVVTPPPPDTTAPTVSISPAAGTYTSAQSVELTANEAATIYYTLDGSNPTTSSNVYSGPISLNSNTTIKYFAKDTAGNQSTVQTAAYTINIPADTTPPVVTVSPAAGTFSSAQSVTLSANETATIYYTLDGSTPTTSSSVYSSPISISATTTLKYFGRDTAGNSSAVQTAVYTINIPSTPFYLANQSGTINWSQNTGTRGGGVKALKNMTITGIGAKGGATGTWSLWQLDNTTYNITTKLAEGTTLAAPDGSGYRIANGLNISINANDNFLLCFQYATGIDASGTYRFQTGSSANADSSFTWNNRIIAAADGTPIAGHTTDTGYTYDLVIYHT